MTVRFFWRLFIYLCYSGVAALTAFEWGMFYHYPCAVNLGAAIFVSLIALYLLIQEIKSD